jgi:hypothetical protein
LIEESLEVKPPTIWTDEKQRWEESEKRREEKKKIKKEKVSEERRSRCAKVGSLKRRVQSHVVR